MTDYANHVVCAARDVIKWKSGHERSSKEAHLIRKGVNFKSKLPTTLKTSVSVEL